MVDAHRCSVPHELFKRSSQRETMQSIFRLDTSIERPTGRAQASPRDRDPSTRTRRVEPDLELERRCF